MQQRIKIGLSWLLALGIFLSVILVLTGGLIYLKQEGQTLVSYKNVIHPSQDYSSFISIFRGSLELNPFALILLGFLVLVFSQILRVFVLGCFFLQKAEYLLALSSFFIFLILMFSNLGQR